MRLARSAVPALAGRRLSGGPAGLVRAALSPSRMSAGRVAAGAAMVLRPTALPRALGVDAASAQRTSWAVQMLGVRDLALGAGTWLALRRGDPAGARLWLAAGLVSDAVDAVAVGGAAGRGLVRPGPAGAAVAVAVVAVAVEAAALADR